MMLSEQPLKRKQDGKPLFEDCFGFTIKSQEMFSLGSGPLIIGRFDPGTGPWGWNMLTLTAESKNQPPGGRGRGAQPARQGQAPDRP